jgi:hypothetical protein
MGQLINKVIEMGINNFDMKAIALAVSLAMVSSGHAQTEVTTGAGAITATGGDINNSQNISDDVLANTAGDVLIGTAGVDGETGAVTIDASANSVGLFAAANGLLVTDVNGDVSALGSSINLIDIPSASSDPSHAISSGQLSGGAVSTEVEDSLVIGARLSGTVNGAIDADVSNNDVQLSAQANAVDNRIEGDLSSAIGASNGGLASASTSATEAIAGVSAGSDLSIASAQTANGRVSSTQDFRVFSSLDPTVGLIGVELGTLDDFTANSTANIVVNSSSLSVDAGANVAVNQIDVDGGGALSKNIANAQLVTANSGVTADINFHSVGVTSQLLRSIVTGTPTNNNFDGDLTLSVNDSLLSVDADGNQATNQIIAGSNVDSSQQAIVSFQTLEGGDVEATANFLDIGFLDENANPDFGAGELAVEVSSTEVDVSANGNSVGNNIVLQGISTNTTNNVVSTQASDATLEAQVEQVDIGIVSNVLSQPNIVLDVASSRVTAESRVNNAVNQVILSGIATGATNSIDNDQNNEEARSSAGGVLFGLDVASGDVGLGDVNIVNVIANQIEANANANNAQNSISFVEDASATNNSVDNDQFSGSSLSRTIFSTAGVSLRNRPSGNASIDLTVSSTNIQALATGNSAANVIALSGGGTDSNNDIVSRQAVVDDTDAEANDAIIGLFYRSSSIDGSGNNGSVTVEALSSTLNSSAIGNSVTSSIVQQGSSINTTNTVTSVQIIGEDSTTEAETTDVRVGIDSANDIEPNVVLDVASNQLTSRSRDNNAVNQISLGGIATGAVNTIDNDQNDLTLAPGDISQATVGGVLLGLISRDLFGQGGLNTVNITANQIEANASGNNAVNNISSVEGANTSTNSVNSDQFSRGTDSQVSDVLAGASLSPFDIGAGGDFVNIDLRVSSTNIQALSTGNSADNDITLAGGGTASDNDIDSLQAVVDDTDADTEDVIIGLVHDASIPAPVLIGDLTLDILSSTVNASAIGATIENRIAIGQTATDSTNDIINRQTVSVSADEVNANIDRVSVGVDYSDIVVEVRARSIDLDVSSADITTNASGTQANNQVLFTGNASGTVNAVANDQSVDADVVTNTENDIRVGLAATGAAFNVASGISVSTLANAVSSETNVNSAGNSIDALGSIENAGNTVTNTQQAGAAATIAAESETTSVSLGVSVEVDDAILGLTAAVDSSSNVVSARTRVNTSSNTISVADQGLANNSENRVENTQATGNGSTVISTAGSIDSGNQAVDIGLHINSTTGFVFAPVTSTTNNNTVSSEATVNTAFNAVGLNGLADEATNSIVNTQTVEGDVTSVTGQLVDPAGRSIINIGVRSSGVAIDNTFQVTANSNTVSSAANGNVGVNVIENDTSSQSSVNAITSIQSNTGGTDGTRALTNALNIGADVDDLGDLDTFSVSANANQVTASSSLNAVNNIINLQGIATGADNDINNVQTATLIGINGAEVNGVVIGLTTNDSSTADLDSVTGDVQGNNVNADTVGNRAFNTISVADFGASAGNDVANTQTITSAGNSLGATVSNVDLGLSFSADVTASGDLIAQTFGNDVAATATGNTGVNTVASRLFGGVGATINNAQRVDNTSISASVGSVSIGINGGANTLGDTNGRAITVTASGNSIRAAAIGNSAVNRITGLGI